MRISIILPVLNEEECIGPLLEEIALLEESIPIEDVIVVDDGSTDATADLVVGLKSKMPRLRLLQHTQRRGQSVAIHTGARHARGDLLVTMDGDGQNNPADVPALFRAYAARAESNPRVMVAGQRVNRKDTSIRRLSSRIANAVRSSLLDDGVRDTGCSLKLFRRDDFLALPFFNHIHRYIPALMKATGVELVLVDVSHRARERGTSKYGIFDRLWVGLYDLVGVGWLIARTPSAVDEKEV